MCGHVKVDAVTTGSDREEPDDGAIVSSGADLVIEIVDEAREDEVWVLTRVATVCIDDNRRVGMRGLVGVEDGEGRNGRRTSARVEVDVTNANGVITEVVGGEPPAGLGKIVLGQCELVDELADETELEARLRVKRGQHCVGLRNLVSISHSTGRERT